MIIISYDAERVFGPSANENMRALDQMVEKFMERYNVKRVGSGMGFGFRDLEFEGDGEEAFMSTFENQRLLMVETGAKLSLYQQGGDEE